MTIMPNQPRRSRAVTRQRIQDLLKLHGTDPERETWQTPAQIAVGVGKSLTYVRALLTDLEAVGQARRTRDTNDHKTVLWSYSGDSDA